MARWLLLACLALVPAASAQMASPSFTIDAVEHDPAFGEVPVTTQVHWTYAMTNPMLSAMSVSDSSAKLLWSYACDEGVTVEGALEQAIPLSPTASTYKGTAKFLVSYAGNATQAGCTFEGYVAATMMMPASNPAQYGMTLDAPQEEKVVPVAAAAEAPGAPLALLLAGLGILAVAVKRR